MQRLKISLKPEEICVDRASCLLQFV